MISRKEDDGQYVPGDGTTKLFPLIN